MSVAATSKIQTPYSPITPRTDGPALSLPSTVFNDALSAGTDGSQDILSEAEVEHLPLECISEFEELLDREGVLQADLLIAYEKLPEVLRDTIEGLVFLHEAGRRGGQQVTDHRYGEHVVAESIEVLYPIRWREKFAHPSPKLSHLLDLLDAKEKDSTVIREAFDSLGHDVQCQIYRYVYEEHATEYGKPLCPDPDGELFGKSYIRQNLIVLKEGTLWKAAIRDSIIATAGRVDALQYRIPGKFVLDPITINGSFEDSEQSFDTVCFLISSGVVLKNDVLARATIFALENDRFADLLLAFSQARHRPSGYSLDSAFKSLAGKVFLPDAMIALWKKGRSISQESIDKAVTLAAEHGHLTLVQFLMVDFVLSSGPTISEKALKDSIALAKKGSHCAVAVFLLDDSD